MTNLTQTDYNKFTSIKQIPYNLVTYLMNNNDYIWKLLKYDDAEAWNKTNLTLTQKSELIYNGVRKIGDCRVFLDTGADDSIVQESTILRISVVEAIPNNYVFGNLIIAFETYVFYKINALSDYSPRNLAISEEIIKVFNGTDIDGVGRLFFDARASAKNRLYVMGNIPYKGICVLMSNHSLG